MSTTSDPPPRAPRSQFLQKLHGLLEHPLDPNGLRWVTDDSFEISTKDAVAIHALSPAFEFNSYVALNHPSGFFVRNDPSRLNQIVRKPRSRPEKGRRVSTTSSRASDEMPLANEPPAVPELPAWMCRPEYQRSAFSGRASVNLPSLSSSFASRSDFGQWRNYVPTGGGWLDPNRADASDRFSSTPRRSSLGDFKLAAPTFSSGLAGVPEARPPLRKAASSLTVQTQNLLAQQPYFQHASVDFRSSPYPTPTFSPTTNTYFSGANTTSHDYYAAPAAGPAWTPAQQVQSHSHLAYEPSPFAHSYQPVATTKVIPAHDLYHTPSPDASPVQTTATLPAINHFDAAPPHLVVGGSIGHASAGSGSEYSQMSALSTSPSRSYYSTQQQPAWSPAPIRNTSYV
ncbi:hypothetical protein JCM10295v2_006718 [Rhodotorula toruloides]